MTPRVPEPDEIAEDLRDLKSLVESTSADTRRAIADLSDRIEERYVPRETFNLQMRRVEKLEDRSTWIARLAVSGLVLPIIVAVVAAILIAGLAS